MRIHLVYKSERYLMMKIITLLAVFLLAANTFATDDTVETEIKCGSSKCQFRCIAKDGKPVLSARVSKVFLKVHPSGVSVFRLESHRNDRTVVTGPNTYFCTVART